jgi:tetratricopeptide (TPR) repeat protein
MNRKFIYLASGLFLVVSIVMGGVYWFITRPVSTPSASNSSPQEMGSQKVSLKPVLPPPMPNKVRVRLAIGSLGFGGDDADRQLSDLVLAQLSDAPGLDLVERQSLDKVLGELGLNLSGLVRANDAVRAGKLLHADWFLLGTRAKIAGTNSVVVRIVDARTGIMRDAGVVAEGDLQTQLAGGLASFVREARQSAVAPKPRVYLAIGAFEDLSANNRLADFATQLRGDLISAYRGDAKVILLEREYADVLLQELELDLAGLTDDTGSPPQPLQSAFWLVDGTYQTYQGSDGQIEVAFNVQRMFGDSHHESVHDVSAEQIGQKIKENADLVMSRDTAAIYPNRRTEINTLISEGTQAIASGGGVNYAGMDDQQAARNLRNANEAIKAFQTALALDPTNRKAKWYLAKCYNQSIIGRRDEARNYFREILDESARDEWGHQAQQALDFSFRYYASPEQKSAWFASAAAGTTNADALKFYEQEAKDAGIQAVIKSGGTNAQAVAEQRLFSNITNVFAGGAGLSEFERAFGTNQAAAAARLAELYPRLQEQAPNIAPYILADIVVTQVDTNSPLIATFQQMMEHLADQPESVWNSENFWPRAFSIADWSYKHGLYGLAATLLEGKIHWNSTYPYHRSQFAFQQQVIASIPPFKVTTEEQITLALADKHLERWQKALDIFTTYSNLPVRLGNGPWGSATVILTANEVTTCREKLGLPNPADPLRFDMGPPVLPVRGLSTFAADQNGVWVGIAGQLRHLDFGLHDDKVIQLPVRPFNWITSIALSDSNVWLGTAGGGLLSYDKTTGTCTQFTVDNGLMMNFVTCLFMEGDHLWIGYGQSELPGGRGGLGRLDLQSMKFTAFVPSMTGTSAYLNQMRINPVYSEPPDAPPRANVLSVLAQDDGNVWFVNERDPLRHYSSHDNLWEPIPKVGTCSMIVLAGNKLYAGQTLLSYSGTKPDLLGVLIYDPSNGSVQTFPGVPGLPDETITAIAPDGGNLWIGGLGYIALFDPGRDQIKHFAYIQSLGVARIAVAGNYLWAHYAGNLYRAPLGDLR